MISLLSPEQREALKEQPTDTPLRIVDETNQDSYVLLPVATYERVRALFEPEPFDPSEAALLMDEVAAAEGWDDAAMDAYDTLDPRRQP